MSSTDRRYGRRATRSPTCIFLLPRTTPFEEVKKKTDGLTLFLVYIAKAGASLKARPIRTMLNHHTNEVFIDNLEVSDDDRIGEEGRGFHYLVEFNEIPTPAGDQRVYRRRSLVHRTGFAICQRARRV